MLQRLFIRTLQWIWNKHKGNEMMRGLFVHCWDNYSPFARDAVQTNRDARRNRMDVEWTIARHCSRAFLTLYSLRISYFFVQIISRSWNDSNIFKQNQPQRVPTYRNLTYAFRDAFTKFRWNIWMEKFVFDKNPIKLKKLIISVLRLKLSFAFLFSALLFSILWQLQIRKTTFDSRVYHFVSNIEVRTMWFA